MQQHTHKINQPALLLSSKLIVCVKTVVFWLIWNTCRRDSVKTLFQGCHFSKTISAASKLWDNFTLPRNWNPTRHYFREYTYVKPYISIYCFKRWTIQFVQLFTLSSFQLQKQRRNAYDLTAQIAKKSQHAYRSNWGGKIRFALTFRIPLGRDSEFDIKLPVLHSRSFSSSLSPN